MVRCVPPRLLQTDRRRYNDALDRAAAAQVSLNPRPYSYYTNEFGRSATNGAFDARLLWEWLRDPRAAERTTPTPGEDEVMRMRDIISPYFGRDTILT